MKPENFAIGKYDTWLIYMFGEIVCSTIRRKKMYDKHLLLIHADFGLCQKYLDEDGKHVLPGRSARYGPGTVEFMSIRAHKTQKLSRRDDIEGIGYLILYFLQGTLPWTEDLDSNDYQTTSNVVQQKKIDFKVEVSIPTSSTVLRLMLIEIVFVLFCSSHSVVMRPGWPSFSNIHGNWSLTRSPITSICENYWTKYYRKNDVSQ